MYAEMLDYFNVNWIDHDLIGRSYVLYAMSYVVSRQLSLFTLLIEQIAATQPISLNLETPLYCIRDSINADSFNIQ